MSGERQEFYGANVESALEKAAATLGVSPEEIEYDVLDEGSAGFLGIGARDARISVLTPTQASPTSVPRQPESEQPGETEDLDPASEEEEEPTRDSLVAAAEPPDAETTVSEEALLEIDRFLTNLVDAMGLDAIVDVYEGDEAVVANVSSPQAGLFIGQKGETIDAAQHLVNVFASKDLTVPKRIVVDAEGYRQRRVEALQGMAHRTARRVIREKRPVSLPPMPAAERRVVHVFLAEDERVATSSEGTEGKRYVVVSPS